ncbi:MAG: phospholipid carrier-dependent glycosyltransferase [Planctomycetaceae bacterium]|nr:phospholipid carrier-dependent glycosyltransferase [Planctomycetaceae bacterium]
MTTEQHRDNVQPLERRPAGNVAAGLAAAIIVATLFLAWICMRFGLNNPPSSTGDEPFYDSMAWELSRGHGFSVDFTDPDFRRPYDRAAQQDPDLYSLTPFDFGPIAHRPPLFSLIGAVGNVAFGRQFWLLRTINVLLMAATAGILTWYLFRSTHPLIALLMLVIFVLDQRTRLYARAILTESMACFLATLLTISLMQLRRSGKQQWLIAAAVLTGLSVLTRSIVVLWIPGLMLVVFLVLKTRPAEQTLGVPLRRAFLQSILFGGIVAALLVPWGIRNVLLLHTFAPMGTQGLMEMSAGYSDFAWDSRGVWVNLQSQHFFDHLDTQGLTSAERELRIGRESSRRAFEWMRQHPGRVLPLALMKMASEFRPRNPIEVLTLILMLVGLLLCRNEADGRLLIGLLVINALAIGATWSVEGRFLVPQLFVIYAAGGIGLQRIKDRCFTRAT